MEAFAVDTKLSASLTNAASTGQILKKMVYYPDASALKTDSTLLDILNVQTVTLPKEFTSKLEMFDTKQENRNNLSGYGLKDPSFDQSRVKDKF